MNKHPNPMTNLPKEVLNYIKQQEKFQKEIHKQMTGLTGGFNKQEAERRRITKEFSVVNKMIKEHQKETDRLKYNLRNILP